MSSDYEYEPLDDHDAGLADLIPFPETPSPVASPVRLRSQQTSRVGNSHAGHESGAIRENPRYNINEPIDNHTAASSAAQLRESPHQKLEPPSLQTPSPDPGERIDPDFDSLDQGSGEPSAEEAEESGREETGDELPLKRSAEDPAAFRPLKRQKGNFSSAYINLFNAAVEDASHRVVLNDEAEPPNSQIGLTFWSSIEKKLLFEAVARLGKDDLQGISERVGSKSPVEVRHYIEVLEAGLRRYTDNGSGSLVSMEEYPAAMELSQQCCHALDDAADALSLKQERREQHREEKKWAEVWDLTPDISRRLRAGDKSLQATSALPSIGLFHLHNWLSVSQRIFLNSSVPADNWNHIDDVPPSIWTSTFEDFYSLTVSITRRLVQTAIYAASTRIKSQRERHPHQRSLVRGRDIRTAAEALNLSPNSRDFWRKSARRLRLVVYDEGEADDEDELLDHDQVEEALLWEDDATKRVSAPDTGAHVKAKPDPETDLDVSTSESAQDSHDSDEETDEYTAESQAIAREADEVFRFSVAPFQKTRRTMQSLGHRIAIERSQEQYAEDLDQHNSYQYELQMWDLLAKAPPRELPRRSAPGPRARGMLDVEGKLPLGRDWRHTTKYVGEWEANMAEEPST
ncbi:RNA polymerase I-specific transcription initiation factor-like protein [Emericellopsis cladophorae]|uniref:RNA polymerase I-specific transcription initiation factor-like protein n=1 Tax=Emericellopsis cladophorae TaxID=2686198 RepID=A0A9P9Y7Z3_9HYPO|nr:RNA polymerase I-specific transcription initiation factor-like protein [Emericellopsis cladophorae]KAI6785156.1 RNA polymerase I-specific transcription initiation factor-like protein [Emericellopsis cladophorae]